MSGLPPGYTLLPPDAEPQVNTTPTGYKTLPPDAQPDAPQAWQSSLWPVSGSGEPGNIRVDPHAGVLGSLIDAFTAPGDVYAGKQPTPYSGGAASIVNPEIPSPDTATLQRATNLALSMSPTSIGSPAVTPKLPPALQTLRAAGIEPTPGIAGGIPGAIETGLSHIPIAGAPINAARTATGEQLQGVLANLRAGGAPDAVIQRLEEAGKSLPAASTTHGGAIGGLAGGGFIAGLLQHPESLTHLLHAVSSPEGLAGLTAAGLSRPLLAGLYSEPGRRAITGLLGATRALPSVPLRRYGPMGAQLVSGLLNQDQR
jgi:hypothetical protein